MAGILSRLPAELRVVLLPWLAYVATGGLWIHFMFINDRVVIRVLGLLVLYQISAWMIAVGIFAGEFAFGTMERLLSQPVQRFVLWRRRIILLWSLLIGPTTLWFLVFAFLDYPNRDLGAYNWGTFPIIIGSGIAPVAALYLRNGLTAVTFGIVFQISSMFLVPLGHPLSFLLGEYIAAKDLLAGTTPFFWGMLVLICIGGHWLSWRLFKNLEV